MEDQQEPKSRGRGFSMRSAAIQRALQLQTSRPGVPLQDVAAAGDAPPPKPRGRADLLETLRKMKQMKIGADPSISTKVEKDLIQDDKLVKNFIGESGRTVPASANYIKLILEPGRGVYEYEVRFEPTIDARSAKFKMLSSIIAEYSKAKTFDGTVLYLPVHIFDQKIFEVKHPFDNSLVRMTIIYKRKTRMADCIHLYNVLFKRIMGILHYKRVGRQYFDNQRPMQIPQHKLEIWPGYVTAVNEYAGGIMLCLDVQHRVLRTQNALSYMYEIMNMDKRHAKDLITKGLIGTSVLTRYNNETYLVHDIMWDINPTNSFETKNGPITYVDYYQRQYGITIQDFNQPMLVNRKVIRNQAGEPQDQLIMLVPELSYMTGLTDGMRADMRIMKDIAQHTCVTPNQRMNSLRKFINSVETNPEARAVLEAWGLRIDQATIDLQMRVLDPETILFGNDVRVHGTEQADWSSAAIRNHVMSAINVHNWLLVYTAQDEQTAREFHENYLRLASRNGITVTPAQKLRMPDDRTDTYMRLLPERISEDTQIMVVISPTSRDDRYMCIKRISCQKIPIASQVINSRTLRNPRKLTTICQKIALQMNCKMGGTLWSVKFPFHNWMICGMDVYHSKSGGKPVCGFVTSINETITRWYSTCVFHSSDKEIADHIVTMFTKALNEFHKVNLAYPKHVIIYRDGVGDGQLEVCEKFEVAQFKQVARAMNLDIKFIFIIVQKRINTRLFAHGFLGRRNDEPGFNNPPPGSIVDQHVTRKNYFDFFLVSQNVRQGTVSPTHYIVLYNDANIKPDNIQRLSYKLCHMYYNWTGTVRVPAPCQYAHKLASLTGQVLKGEHADSLSTRLFYL